MINEANTSRVMKSEVTIRGKIYFYQDINNSGSWKQL